jgi:hypothetical protein
MVIIPYVRVISEKFRCVGNRFNVRTIFKTKHTLCGTLMETGPVGDVQQLKQCVYSIPCDCGRCYISETSGPLEVHIKEYKYNLTQGLLKKSKLAQHAFEEGHKVCWKEARVLQIESNATYRKYKESAPHVSGSSSDQSTQLGHLSCLDPHYCSRSQKTPTPSSVDYVGKLCFYIGTT